MGIALGVADGEKEAAAPFYLGGSSGGGGQGTGPLGSGKKQPSNCESNLTKEIIMKTTTFNSPSGVDLNYFTSTIRSGETQSWDSYKTPDNHADADATDDDNRELFIYSTARECCENSSAVPNPESLWAGMWHEGEISCLFADSNLGKSIYAVQIAEHISRSQKVIYFDFEMSEKQFQRRYFDEETGECYAFNRNLIRAEIDISAINQDEYDHFEEVVISQIERLCNRLNAKVAIIDNISYLCSATDNSEMASRLMIQFMQLKKRTNISMLVLAHTPKRSLTSPLGQNDIAGSKKLFNFFDSVFAIGRSGKDEELRYIKHIKSRATQILYGSDNVMLTEIRKDGNWLHFETIGTCSESDQLKSNEGDELIYRIKELRENGMSMGNIAAQLQISKSKVQRALSVA